MKLGFIVPIRTDSRPLCVKGAVAAKPIVLKGFVRDWGIVFEEFSFIYNPSVSAFIICAEPPPFTQGRLGLTTRSSCCHKDCLDLKKLNPPHFAKRTCRNQNLNGKLGFSGSRSEHASRTPSAGCVPRICFAKRRSCGSSRREI